MAASPTHCHINTNMAKSLDIIPEENGVSLKRFPFLYLKDGSKNLADAGTRKYSQPQSSSAKEVKYFHM